MPHKPTPWSKYVFLLTVLLIIRHIILTFAPWIIFSGYMFMFVIGFVVSYIINNSYYTALFIALLMVYGRMLYRYAMTTTSPKELNDYTGAKNTTVFMLGIITVIGLAHALQQNQKYIPLLRYPIYFMVVYMFFSFVEWILHRYVMHCYMYFPWLDKVDPATTFMPFVTYNMQRSCQLHHDHHKSVNADMSLKDVEHRDSHELTFDWATMIMIIILVAPALFALVWALQLKIGWKVQLVTIFISALVFCLAWNSIHPTMHGAKVRVSIQEGAPNLGWDLHKTNIYYQNHDVHHQIKGDEKGNYNVIFLGADELLMTNRLA